MWVVLLLLPLKFPYNFDYFWSLFCNVFFFKLTCLFLFFALICSFLMVFCPCILGATSFCLLWRLLKGFLEFSFWIPYGAMIRCLCFSWGFWILFLALFSAVKETLYYLVSSTSLSSVLNSLFQAGICHCSDCHSLTTCLVKLFPQVVWSPVSSPIPSFHPSKPSFRPSSVLSTVLRPKVKTGWPWPYLPDS